MGLRDVIFAMLASFVSTHIRVILEEEPSTENTAPPPPPDWPVRKTWEVVS